MIGFDASTLLFALLRRMFGYFAQGIYRALLDVIQTGLSRDALRKKNRESSVKLFHEISEAYICLFLHTDV